MGSDTALFGEGAKAGFIGPLAQYAGLRRAGVKTAPGLWLHDEGGASSLKARRRSKKGAPPAVPPPAGPLPDGGAGFERQYARLQCEIGHALACEAVTELVGEDAALSAWATWGREKSCALGSVQSCPAPAPDEPVGDDGSAQAMSRACREYDAAGCRRAAAHVRAAGGPEAVRRAAFFDSRGCSNGDEAACASIWKFIAGAPDSAFRPHSSELKRKKKPRKKKLRPKRR